MLAFTANILSYGNLTRGFKNISPKIDVEQGLVPQAGNKWYSCINAGTSASTNGVVKVIAIWKCRHAATLSTIRGIQGRLGEAAGAISLTYLSKRLRRQTR